MLMWLEKVGGPLMISWNRYPFMFASQFPGIVGVRDRGSCSQ